MAEIPRHGDIIANKKNVLRVFIITIILMKTIKKIVCNFRTIFVRTNKEFIRINEDVDTKGKSVFIQLKEALLDYKGTQRFLKTTLFFMYGEAFPFQLKNLIRSGVQTPVALVSLTVKNFQ